MAKNLWKCATFCHYFRCNITRSNVSLTLGELYCSPIKCKTQKHTNSCDQLLFMCTAMYRKTLTVSKEQSTHCNRRPIALLFFFSIWRPLSKTQHSINTMCLLSITIEVLHRLAHCTVNFRCFPPGGFMHCQQWGKQRIRRQASYTCQQKWSVRKSKIR